MKTFSRAVALLVLGLPLTTFAAVPGGVPVGGGRLAPVLQKLAGQGNPGMLRALSPAIPQRGALGVRFNRAGEVQVVLHLTADASVATTSLTRLGAHGVLKVPALRQIQAWVPTSALQSLAALPGVNWVGTPRYAHTRALRPLPGAQTRTGSVNSEGDAILGAAQFRSATGADGSGEPVGVISDGVGTVSGNTSDDIQKDQATGDLPTSPAPWLDTQVNGGGSGDEGTAMMEIVHDLAPGAPLGFCGPATDADYLICLSDFVNNSTGFRPRVIVDDLGFPGVALFKHGGFASAVQGFAKQHPNIQLVTAAGNDNGSFWSGNWSPTPVSVTIQGQAYSHAQNFGTTAAPTDGMQIRVGPGDTMYYILQWNDTWVDSDLVNNNTPNDSNDYDVVLTDANGNVLACNQGENLGSAATPQPSPTLCPTNSLPTLPYDTPGPQPIQGNNWTNPSSTDIATVYLHVYYRAGDPGNKLKILVGAQTYQTPISPNTDGSVYGQSALPLPDEISVGAIDAAKAGAQPPNLTIESFSSLGPVLLSQPGTGDQTYVKPDFTGIDGVSVTGQGGFPNPFYGTSAAAPHIAALIALLEDGLGFTGKSPEALLRAGVQPIGTGSPNDTYGYGLPNAYQSAVALEPQPTAAISQPAASATVKPGAQVAFAADCSLQGAPGNLGYDWNFGSGSGIADSSSKTPSVSYANTGTYTVTLTCTNTAFNTSATATRTITVSDQAGGGTPSGGSGSSGGRGLGGGGGATGPATLLLLLATALLAERRRRAGPAAQRLRA